MAALTVDLTKLKSNVVPKEAIQKVQEGVLKDLADTLRNCYGPQASNTLILIPTGENGIASQKPISKYTKDGRHIQEKIVYTGMLENAIAGQIESITSRVDGESGDGTTSATLLSYFLYMRLKNIIKNNSTRLFTSTLHDIINEIIETIPDYCWEPETEDIYHIAYTSTNGNKQIAEELKSIYEDCGNEVWINVEISSSTESVIKRYDGLTLQVGYSDVAYVNSENGTTILRNPKIYYFSDSIDSAEMVSFLAQIIQHNVYDQLEHRQPAIPTLIISPKISRDADAVITELVTFLHRFYPTDKPPIAIVTNIGPYLASCIDITTLCGCRRINKYIDPKVQDADIKKGLAPNLDTIHEWCGTADEVVIDAAKTAFINPAGMFERGEDGFIKVDENGEFVKGQEFLDLEGFLSNELQNAIDTGDNIDVIGSLRRRLHALGSSLVDYYVGGIGVEDRTAVKDLVEDAVKNCRSAIEYGAIYAANCTGLLAARSVQESIYEEKPSDLEKSIVDAIVHAYEDLIYLLYEDEVNGDREKFNNEILEQIVQGMHPLNLETGQYDGTVMCSVKTDQTVLHTVGEIVSYIVTANQALLPVASQNYYRESLGQG